MPIIGLFFDITAGPAGLNLVAIGVYLALISLAICAYMERGWNE